MLSQELHDILTQTVNDEAAGGGVLGYPLLNVKLTIIDADERQGETTELAIRAAAADSVRKALTDAGAAAQYWAQDDGRWVMKAEKG